MKKLLFLIAACALALSLPASAFAEGGTGSGGGQGGGKGEPLEVSSASIEDGGEVAADGSITLVFSKNVCEASVRDANKALASVKDASGADVEVVVELADDQVEPSKKNDMVISFAQPLAEGTYTLTVKAGVEAKSGDTLAEDYVLTFTVAAQGSAAAAPVAASGESESASAAAASAESASASSSAASSAASASSTSSDNGNDSFGMSDVLPIVGIFLVLMGGVLLAMRMTNRTRK